MPSLGCHVPEDSPLYAAAQERAKAGHAGKVSAYVRSLIERDVGGTATVPPATDPRFLEKLFAAVLPSRVSRFQRLWDAKTRLGESGPAQAELVESFLRALLQEMEAEPTAQLVNAFDALPPPTLAALVTAANTGDAASLRRDPNILRYTQPEESSQHVAEDPAPAARTLRALPLKPPKPPSTGTTP